MTSLGYERTLTRLVPKRSWAVERDTSQAWADEPILADLAPVPVEDVAVSIVIPLLNEEESLEILYKQITAALVNLNQSYEIILVDDGSTDRSYEILKSLHERDGRVQVIRFRRNFGQTAAFSAGFDLAR